MRSSVAKQDRNRVSTDTLKRFGENDWHPEEHPCLRCVSPGMLGLRIVPVLKSRSLPEYVKIPVSRKHLTEVDAALGAYNLTWQSEAVFGPWRFWGKNMAELPDPIRKVLERAADDRELRLVPWDVAAEGESVAAAYASLYQQLPLGTLHRFGLPPFGSRTWPCPPHFGSDPVLPPTLYNRLATAVGHHVWRFLDRQSPQSAFSAREPLRLLVNNLDFWLPYADLVAKKRMLDPLVKTPIFKNPFRWGGRENSGDPT
jgi:hypothetical protein